MSRAPDNPDIQVALNHCGRDPVHIPGRIQAFGCLLGLTPDAFEVQYASQNASEILTAIRQSSLA